MHLHEAIETVDPTTGEIIPVECSCWCTEGCQCECVKLDYTVYSRESAGHKGVIEALPNDELEELRKTVEKML